MTTRSALWQCSLKLCCLNHSISQPNSRRAFALQATFDHTQFATMLFSTRVVLAIALVMRHGAHAYDATLCAQKSYTSPENITCMYPG